eukprot:scaffold71451_cov34-Prasinocladus_malaysianus.AAC.1
MESSEGTLAALLVNAGGLLLAFGMAVCLGGAAGLAAADVLLLVVDGMPMACVGSGLAAQFCYMQMLQGFPFIPLSDPKFIVSSGKSHPWLMLVQRVIARVLCPTNLLNGSDASSSSLSGWWVLQCVSYPCLQSQSSYLLPEKSHLVCPSRLASISTCWFITMTAGDSAAESWMQS